MAVPDLVHKQPVSLDNCADEPIHTPGSIQGNGALLAFDLNGRLCAFSSNSAAMLGVEVAQGDTFAPLLASLSAAVVAAVAETIALAGSEDVAGHALELTLGTRAFDVVVHSFHSMTVVEFELRFKPSDVVASFAIKASQAMNGLKTVRNIDLLLQRTVEQVGELTGFDRVMAYRFRHDDSGEVVAEFMQAALEPFLGRRYPASDIPVQARRLYTINTLRSIHDVNAAPVPLLGTATDVCLDLSQSVLRSVSPIHIEYLQNMGVGASMSISIVVNGALWGLVACHHMSAHSVPYSIRMTCDVLAQVVAFKVQQLLARDDGEFLGGAAKIQSRLADALLHADDVFATLQRQGDSLRELFDADALILVEQSKLSPSPELSAQLALLIATSIPEGAKDMVRRDRRDQWPDAVQSLIGPWVGMLALPFDHSASGWIIALRKEQVETVRWGGRDEKVLKLGPNGARLSPRGSFDEWRETVRDTAKPWARVTLQVGRDLLDELRRASRLRHDELEQSRAQLLAMLGHDLRDPLNSINMATAVLSRADHPEERVVQRISTASGRMQRLIADVLDMSRMQSGIGLGLKRRDSDVTALLESFLAEVEMAHPAVTFVTDIAAQVSASVDEDRLVQAVSNLLSNARHHGAPGKPVRFSLRQEDGTVLVQVANVAAAIDAEVEVVMFNPFKHTSVGNPRNRTGLGLGLYISQQIALGHGGGLSYRHVDPEVIFTLSIPVQA